MLYLDTLMDDEVSHRLAKEDGDQWLRHRTFKMKCSSLEFRLRVARKSPSWDNGEVEIASGVQAIHRGAQAEGIRTSQGILE